MRRLSPRMVGAVLLVVALGRPLQAGAPAPVSLRGTVVLEGHYCGGGARVTPEMDAAAHTKTPIAGVAFLASRGERIEPSKRTTPFRTDQLGRFSVALAPGTWCIYPASRKPPAPSADVPVPVPGPRSPNIDAGCLEALALRCDAVITVTRNTKTIEVAVQASCPQPWNQPCYHGPMPP